MSLPLTKEIEDCLAHAAHCARQAKNAACLDVREDFLRLEQNWLQLARSYEVAQQLATTRINGSSPRAIKARCAAPGKSSHWKKPRPLATGAFSFRQLLWAS